LISAIFWEGSEAELIELVEKGVIEAYTSPQILDELERVLLSQKFKLRKDEVSNLVGYFTTLTHVMIPKSTIHVIPEDPSDNRIIECALEVKADLIVSGDKHLLALKEFKGVKVRRASETLKLINEGAF
jgi:putative PIN family toxin of toxin-antitoxin system